MVTRDILHLQMGTPLGEPNAAKYADASTDNSAAASSNEQWRPQKSLKTKASLNTIVHDGGLRSTLVIAKGDF